MLDLRWRCVVGIGALITIAVVWAAARFLWKLGGVESGLAAFWFRNGPALLVLGMLVAIFAPSGGTSRFVRLAVLLPIVHVVVILASWRAFTWLGPQLSDLPARSHIVTPLPVLPTVAVMAAALAVSGGLVAWRRRGEWIHAVTIIALVDLLLLGLWLPCAAHLWPLGEPFHRPGTAPLALAALAVVPPFVVASAFAALCVRRPDRVRALRIWLAIFVVLGLAVAIVWRSGASRFARIAFDNLVHFALAAAGLAAAALLGLAIATWRRGATARRVMANEHAARTGTIVPDEHDDVPGSLEITSWLRGPCTRLRAFVVATPRGDLHVPQGALLAAAIPPVTTVLRVGEAVAMLRAGDRVALGGLVEHTAFDSPFRSATVHLPGPRGIVVCRWEREIYGFAHVALGMWRPCVAYVVIAIAVALPALLGMMTEPPTMTFIPDLELACEG
jgi:hypothetical protein